MKELSLLWTFASARKLMLLAVTAAPGLQRLVFISALSYCYTTSDVGIAAADLGVASFMALFAGGAVSGQVMALWGRYPDSTSRRVLNRQGMCWQLGALLVASATAWGLHSLHLVGSTAAVLLFFAGFSAWQVERTKLLSDRRLGLLTSIEMALIVLVALGAAWSASASVALGLYGLVLLAAGIAVAPAAHRGAGIQNRDSADVCGGLGYKGMGALAINGMVSSGREQLTIPAVRLIADNSMAGVIAQVSTLVAALLLLPRALANNYVPSLSRYAGYGAGATAVLRQYARAMCWTLVAITAALLAAVPVLWLFEVALGYLRIALLAGLALIAGQISLLPSTVLTVRQAVAPILTSALVVTIAWAAVVAILGMVDLGARTAVMLLLGFSVIAAVLRAGYLQRVMNSLNSRGSGKTKEVNLT